LSEIKKKTTQGCHKSLPLIACHCQRCQSKNSEI
jgi:hypothetical protein